MNFVNKCFRIYLLFSKHRELA